MRTLAMAVLALAVTAHAALASSWFPNRATDTLTYTNLRYGGDSTARVDSTSGSWQHWTDFGGLGPMWVWTSSTSEQVWIWANGQRVLFADLSATVGSAWPLNGVLPNYTNVSLTRRAFVTVTPGGTFQNCVMLDLGTNAVDFGVGGLTFAPGVGIVQWFNQSIAGPVRHAFKSGAINAVAWPKRAVAGLRCDGWTDQYEYWVDASYQPSGATKLTASITVRNSMTQSMPMWFMSGQSYDIALEDADGNILNVWSANKRFTNQMRQLTLAAGQSMTFKDTIDLVRLDGQPLAEGTYRARIWLTAVQGVESQFTIQVRQAR